MLIFGYVKKLFNKNRVAKVDAIHRDIFINVISMRIAAKGIEGSITILEDNEHI